MINTMKKLFLSILLFSASIANAANSYNILDVASGGASGGSPITGCSTPSKILFIDPSINLDCTNGPTYDSGSNTATLNINGTVGATTLAAGAFTSVTDSGLTATRIPIAGTGGLLGDSSTFTWAAAAGQGLVAGAGTNSAAATRYLIDGSQTLNNAAALGGMRLVYTDTLSGSGFLPLAILGGSAGTTDLFHVDKSGFFLGAGATFKSQSGVLLVKANSNGIDVDATTTADGALSINGNILGLRSGSILGWGSSATSARGTADTGLTRGAANTVAVGNGTAGNASGTLTLATLSASATVKTGGFTVAGLPAAGTAGRHAYVTDQLTTCAATGAAILGGGAVVCPVFDNGVAWVGG